MASPRCVETRPVVGSPKYSLGVLSFVAFFSMSSLSVFLSQIDDSTFLIEIALLTVFFLTSVISFPLLCLYKWVFSLGREQILQLLRFKYVSAGPERPVFEHKLKHPSVGDDFLLLTSVL